MSRRRPKLAISVPIIMGAVTVLLSIALIVGWIFVLYQNSAVTRKMVQNTWLLVGGILSLVAIIAVLVLLCVFLVREILEGRRQETFIDSVTHELKSPLASIKLCLETLARPQLTEAQRLELHHMMGLDVERLAVFIDEILEANRVLTGRRGYTWSTVHVAALAERCVDVLCRRHRIDRQVVTIDVPDNVSLTTDGQALETVLTNLLDNAIKYSEKDIHVRLWARESEGKKSVVISVKDHGIGIPRAHIKRIFERFYRVPHERVRMRGGTGIGLYLVAALVRNLGGKLEASSEGMNTRGTTVSITLPLKRRELGRLALPTNVGQGIKP